MDQNRVAGWQLAGFLRVTDLRQQPLLQKGSQHGLDEPGKARVVRVAFTQHEVMEVRVLEREAEERPGFLADPVDGWQIGVRRCLPVPGRADFRERVLSDRAPKD